MEKADAVFADESTYDPFYVMSPPALDSIREMFLTKFDELFGLLVTEAQPQRWD